MELTLSQVVADAHACAVHPLGPASGALTFDLWQRKYGGAPTLRNAFEVKIVGVVERYGKLHTGKRTRPCKGASLTALVSDEER